MTPPDLISAAESPRALAQLNRWLADRTAAERVAWGLTALAGPQVLSSSFGAQAAAALHLVNSQQPGIPVILIDTGFLFPETYAFAAQLRKRLGLRLHIERPQPDKAWPEAKVQRLAELGVEAIAQYNQIHKVEPMRRALAAFGAQTWIAGLRRSQSASREGTDFLELQQGRWKLHPIADWSDRQVGAYLRRHDLPYHPLWQQGFVSIGDRYSSQPLQPGMRAEDTRFFGLKRECGLHESWSVPTEDAA